MWSRDLLFILILHLLILGEVGMLRFKVFVVEAEYAVWLWVLISALILLP